LSLSLPVERDLRGTAITMPAEAGATVPEIAAVTGHSLEHVTSIPETYLSRTRHLAAAAIVNLEKHATLSRTPAWDKGARNVRSLGEERTT
jgi:hypothetical protein